MRKIYSTLLAGLCFANNVIAQSPQFVNGSLEPTSTVNPCTVVDNLTFNTQMGPLNLAIILSQWIGQPPVILQSLLK